MNPEPRTRRRFAQFTAWAAVLAFGLSACGTKYIAVTTTPLSVPAEYESDRHDAVLRALAAKRYAVESDDGSHIVGAWSRGGLFYRVAIALSPSITLRYVDSNEDPGPPGTAPELYARYMRILHRTIERELGRPIREAQQQAEEDEANAEAHAAASEHQAARRLAEEARRRRTVLITSGRSPADVRRIVVQELRDRRYTIEEEHGTTIVARWTNDERFYRLSVTLSATNIVLQYIDSDHLHDDEEDGVQLLDERYVDYMGRLERDINDEVNGG